MERVRVDKSVSTAKPVRRESKSGNVDAHLRLGSAIGNRAFTRLVQKGGLLQRSVWEWDGTTWRLKSGSETAHPPVRPGEVVGEEYDDEVQEEEPRGEKREREGDEAGGVLDWLEESANVSSEYSSDVKPRKVHHRIPKDEKDKACFEWALRGLADEGPNPEHFWSWLIGLPGMEEPDWVNQVAGGVRAELISMADTIRERALAPWFTGAAVKGPAKRSAAKGIVTRACQIIVEQCGFKVVSEDAAAGWVVCQYKLTQGAAFPEHWWLELRTSDGGTLVLQTVTGIDIEIGGTDLRWHSRSSAEGRNAEVDEYDMVRIPVQALLPAHLTILRRGMEDERGRARPKIGTSSRGRGRGQRGGRGGGSGSRGRGRGS